MGGRGSRMSSGGNQLPTLKGSEKQISYANDLIGSYLRTFDIMMKDEDSNLTSLRHDVGFDGYTQAEIKAAIATAKKAA